MKILILSTYPSSPATHGGQHRLKNIISVLEGHGHAVQSCGVLGSASYQQVEGFVEFPGHRALSRYISNSWLMDDWAIGQLFAHDDKYYKNLERRVTITPDIIFCEQPWLFRFAERLSRKYRKTPPIIYGSQNIEYRLKREIAHSYFSDDTAQEYSHLVHMAELEAIKSAALTICVSDDDAAEVKAMGGRSCVVAANGVVDRRATLHDVAAANAITDGRKFALYCASAHPPNIKGFFDLFGGGVGCFPPESRLVVAGTAGGQILGSAQFGQISGLASVFVDCGLVSESVLSGLLSTAHAILLPVTQGGGTNLKTAEAIWAGKHIVATPTAMRGFERFSHSPGIAIAESAPEFLRSVRQKLSAPANRLTSEARQQRRSVLWTSTLRPLAEALQEVKQ